MEDKCTKNHYKTGGKCLGGSILHFNALDTKSKVLQVTPTLLGHFMLKSHKKVLPRDELSSAQRRQKERFFVKLSYI